MRKLLTLALLFGVVLVLMEDQKKVTKNFPDAIQYQVAGGVLHIYAPLKDDPARMQSVYSTVMQTRERYVLEVYVTDDQPVLPEEQEN